ncbi:hypothetical protein ACS0TY_033245 [Phlomoides rotata]
MEAEKWIKHYSSRHKILLVGEGNFSFALSLATALPRGKFLLCSEFSHSIWQCIQYGMLWMTHPTAAANLVSLKAMGCTVIHDVDARTMSTHHLLSYKKFDRIVFNFPHAGFITFENDSYQISRHQDVVRGFLKNASEMVTEGGEVHVTHKTGRPYSEWRIKELGEEARLVLSEEAKFCLSDYPGYINKRGAGNRSDESFPEGQCSTYKFVKNGYRTLFNSIYIL